MYFTDGNTLDNVIKKALYQRSVTALIKRGMSEASINRMKPWAVFTFLNMPENSSGTFLDAKLYQDAVAGKKNVIGLETVDEHIAVFDGLDFTTQAQLLEITLNEISDMKKILDGILEVYLTRDLQKILAINEKYNQFMGPELAVIFNQRLLIDRNHRMLERSLPLLNTGVFIAVGALHLPGESGLIRLFREKGYTLEPIY